MNPVIIINGKQLDIKNVPSDSRIGILTGTFDPAHASHVDIARHALKDGIGAEGVEIVLFYLHSYNINKKPAPYYVRMEILKAVLPICNNLGILLVDEDARKEYATIHHRELSPTSTMALFEYLNWYHRASYARIIGSDRLKEKLSECRGIRHYVSPRNTVFSPAVEGVSMLPMSSANMSSSRLRSGSMPFTAEYKRLCVLIRQSYPKAIFSWEIAIRKDGQG